MVELSQGASSVVHFEQPFSALGLKNLLPMFFFFNSSIPVANFEKPPSVDTHRSQEAEGSLDHRNRRRLQKHTDRKLLAAKYQNGSRPPKNLHDVLRSPLR